MKVLYSVKKFEGHKFCVNFVNLVPQAKILSKILLAVLENINGCQHFTKILSTKCMSESIAKICGLYNFVALRADLAAFVR